MTTSKGFFAAAALAGVACLTIGYHFERPSAVPASVQPAPAPAPAAVDSHTPPDFSDSSLVAQWQALHAKHGTNASAMPLLYAAIREETNSFRRLALATAHLSEWSQVDPAAGLKFLLAKSGIGDERLQLFREWLDRDPQTAVNNLLAAGKGWQSVAKQSLVDIARTVPALTPTVVAGLPAPEGFWDSEVRDAFAAMTEKDPSGARQAAEALSGPNRDAALGGVAKQWAQSDLDAAVAWAKALPEGTDRNEIIRNALIGRASVAPAEALNSLNLVPSGGRTDYFASSTGARVLAAAAEADFEGTVGWLSAHPGRLNREDLLGMAEAVTTRLNTDAAGFLSAQAAAGNLDVLAEAVNSALLNSAGGQLSVVWDWLKTQPGSPTIEELRKSVLHTSGYDDPKFAMRIAADLPDSKQGNADLRELAQSLFNGGNLLGRFDSLHASAPERLRQPLVEEAFDFLSPQNFSDPQAWVARLRYLPNDLVPTAAGKLAEAWGAYSPAEAIKWANTLAGADAQNAAASAIASGWASKDTQGAATWVFSMPDGTQRDQSAKALVLAAADHYPVDTWNWTLQISDPTARDAAASRVLDVLGKRDPAAAAQLLDAAQLPPDEKSKLHAHLQKGSK